MNNLAGLYMLLGDSERAETLSYRPCETGLGETAGGESILVLQRAFQIAGARTTVTSLWQVDDAVTQTLMVEFYRNLFDRKLSKLDPLRQAQLWLLHHPDALDGRDLTKRGTVRPVNITTDSSQGPGWWRTRRSPWYLSHPFD